MTVFIKKIQEGFLDFDFFSREPGDGCKGGIGEGDRQVFFDNDGCGTRIFEYASIVVFRLKQFPGAFEHFSFQGFIGLAQ